MKKKKKKKKDITGNGEINCLVVVCLRIIFSIALTEQGKGRTELLLRKLKSQEQYRVGLTHQPIEEDQLLQRVK